MDETVPEHEVSTGNVFADIGIPDPETHLLKAQLVSRIGDIIKQRGLTQTKAARLIGIAQPDLSALLRGRFRGHSIERLMRCLTALGCEVDIVIRGQDRAVPAHTIHLTAAE